MGHKNSKTSTTIIKSQQQQARNHNNNHSTILPITSPSSSKPPLQNPSPSSSAANSHEFLPPSLFASYLNTTSSSSIVQQFHTKLSEEQCQLMIKGVIQSYFGIPNIFPVFSEELFESIWALQNILAADSTRNLMLAYSEELYWVNGGSISGNDTQEGSQTPLSSVSPRLAKTHDIFSPIFYTRDQLLKNSSSNRSHHHDGSLSKTLETNYSTTTLQNSFTSNSLPNTTNMSRLKHLTIEWSIKLINQESIVVATHRIPLWIATLRLRRLFQQCKQTTSIDSNGNCKILFPVIEISNQFEAKMLLSVHEMIPLIFELIIMYLSCPMLLFKWMDETEPHNIRELFDDHNISTIQLFTCCEMISQKVFAFLTDFSTNVETQNTIEKDQKISIHEIKNTKAMSNIASYWMTMELLDDKHLNDILTFSKRTQELTLFKQTVSLLARKVTEENTYSFFKIAQELKIDTLTELCNLYTQYSKFKEESSQTKTTRRRSLAMVMLKKTPSEVSLTNSPFQFTKRSYYDTSEMEFALAQISSGKSMQIRVWICGGRKPGKTSLVCRYMFGKFDVTYDTSISESYRKLEGNFVIDLMDSSGQTPSSEVNNIELVRSCDIFVVCYSVKDKNSFSMVEDYIQNFKILKDNTDPIIIIAALQCDSPRSMWQTTTDAGLQLAQQHSALFFEVSSYLGVHVRDVFVSGILEHCRQCSLR
ncbi:hypothetical protein FDP41_006067 [Naegleria fowleri]|uniref:Uncharacterized protein n=1 Tax=Naegleria fowleri TaxID=5763 RepID=A0A6A5BLL1_NAEFO|nr:uncharacterized protein FDP41_006067 [Naegleria fowleri]KAF0974900.1 hypothetical protein FDP41_006067 [Naegleria fowleri]